MRRTTSTGPGPAPRHLRRRLAVPVGALLALGLLSPGPAFAAPGTLFVRDAAVSEAANASVRVVLADRVNHRVTVRYRTRSITAVDGEDFVGVTGRLVFPAGSKVRRIDIAVVDDSRDEDNETFKVRIFEPTRAEIADRRAIVTIVDDDTTPTLSVQDAVVQEGGALLFDVRLSRAADAPVTFRYGTANGTAGSGDYTGVTGTGTVPAGAASTTVTVPTTEDGTYEAGETVLLNLFSLSGAAAGDTQATGTITDDDTAPRLTISDVSVVEGVFAQLTVTLSQASGALTQVEWRTTDGTAKSANSDYVRASGVLSVQPGQTTGTISVRTLDDSVEDFGETLYVDLSAPRGASIGDSRGVVTILDNEGPALSVADASVAEGGNLTLRVSLSRGTSHAVTFTWSTVNGTAGPGDFTARTAQPGSIAAGQTFVDLVVPTTGDTADEPDENLSVTLTNVVGATVADDTAVGRILDDDDPAVVSIEATKAVTEGQSVTLTVSVAPVSGTTVTVAWATADGTGPNAATAAGLDYTAGSGTLSFAPGETTKTVEVRTAADSDTADETFRVVLSSPTNATLGTGTSTVTIDALP